MSVVVLERKGVKGVGDEKALMELCPSLRELHLNFNNITCAHDVRYPGTPDTLCCG